MEYRMCERNKTLRIWHKPTENWRGYSLRCRRVSEDHKLNLGHAKFLHLTIGVWWSQEMSGLRLLIPESSILKWYVKPRDRRDHQLCQPRWKEKRYRYRILESPSTNGSGGLGVTNNKHWGLTNEVGGKVGKCVALEPMKKVLQKRTDPEWVILLINRNETENRPMCLAIWRLQIIFRKQSRWSLGGKCPAGVVYSRENEENVGRDEK